MTPAATWDAVVVGGGVAGLVAARDLARAGLRTLVLEERDAVGGAVAAHTVAGLRLDAGAESFATRGGTVAALARRAGLSEPVVTPEPLGSWVHLPHGDGPLPRTGPARHPGAPGAADVRRTLGLVGALRAALDLVLPRPTAPPTSLGGARPRAAWARGCSTGWCGRSSAASTPPIPTTSPSTPSRPACATRSPGSAARWPARSAALRAAAPAGSAVQGIVGGLHRLVDALVARRRGARRRGPHGRR